MNAASEPEPPAHIQPTMLRPPEPKPTWQIVVGLLLVAPALVMLLISYVLPAVWTVRSSFRRFTGLRVSERDSAGGHNYEQVFERGLAGDLGFALSLAALPLFVLLLLAPAIALAAHRAGRVARWITRGALALPLAAFAPTAAAAGMFFERDGTENAAGVTRAAYWWGTFGLVTALGVTMYLAALRRRDPYRRPWVAMAAGAAVAVAGALAAALQAFTAPFVVGISGEGGSTPARLMFGFGFQLFDFGSAAAIATLLLLVLAVLGVAVTLLTVLSGLRLEFDDAYRSADEPVTDGPAPDGPSPDEPSPDEPARERTAPHRPLLVVGLALLLLGVLLTWWVVSPWLRGSASGETASGRLLTNTWLPPLASTLVGVSVAALAAFGISGLRPLGRHSEWLLLPFGLFLFVGLGPLAIRAYAAGQTAGRLDSFLGLVPPTRLVIPALFVLALLFRGQALRRETLRQEGRTMSWSRVVLPALPMLALAYLVTWVVQAQNLLWQLISAAGDYMTGPVAFVGSLIDERSGPLPYGLVLPVSFLVIMILLAIAAQVLYLDRVALRVGLPERDHGPRT